MVMMIVYKTQQGDYDDNKDWIILKQTKKKWKMIN